MVLNCTKSECDFQGNFHTKICLNVEKIEYNLVQSFLISFHFLNFNNISTILYNYTKKIYYKYQKIMSIILHSKIKIITTLLQILFENNGQNFIERKFL